jgi:hypothetical protein
MSARLSRAAWVFGAIAALAACGGSGGDGTRPPDTTPPANTTPGGVINGKYLLRIEPARECGAPRSVLTYRMNGHPDDTGRRPGVQLALENNPILEMEMQYATPNLQGNIGTTHDLTLYPMELPTTPTWIHGIVTGSVTSENGGPGEVVQGTLAGHVAFNSEDAACFSNAHRWSLRLR